MEPDYLQKIRYVVTAFSVWRHDSSSIDSQTANYAAQLNSKSHFLYSTLICKMIVPLKNSEKIQGYVFNAALSNSVVKNSPFDDMIR